jgi:hypothetical protein
MDTTSDEIPADVVPLTKEELAERKRWAEEFAAQKLLEDARASALQKLAALGLTPDEIRAITV